MPLELRLIRYFVAVGEAGSITRAAEDLHLSQPSLSVALRRLEGELGVALLERHRGRTVSLTPAGSLLLRRGRELLEHAEAIAGEVRQSGPEASGRLRLGLSPTARYGVGPRLLAACAARQPAVMIYTTEDTTGALLRDVAQSRLDLAVTFCAPPPPPGVETDLLFEAPAVVHLPAAHRLASRPQLSLAELAEETILVAASEDSSGFSARILAAFEGAGIKPRTLTDPYPDLGLQAVREGLGIVIYVRNAFPAELEGSAFVPLEPAIGLPFHIASRSSAINGAVRAVREIASALERPVASSA